MIYFPLSAILGKAVSWIKQSEEKMKKRASSAGAALDKRFAKAKEMWLFFEFFGPNSFDGVHVENDEHQVALIDVILSSSSGLFHSILSYLLHAEPNPIDGHDFYPVNWFVKTCFSSTIKFPKELWYTQPSPSLLECIKQSKTGHLQPLLEGAVCKGKNSSGQVSPFPLVQSLL